MSREGTEETHKNIGKLLHSKSITKRSIKRKSHGNTSTPLSKKKVVDYLTSSKRNEIKCRNACHKTAKSMNMASLEGDQNQLPTAAKLQRRSRYLLIKMRIEQNLIDAYSTEGWKGQSREKIKPERELQRAKKQILQCKLGLRDALHQLDLLSSDGSIDDSVIGQDGTVHHDHIHCAKCKLREAFPDNDIILCDGTCNCAFHQMCIDPPLLTENIPPGDQGWFCKYCVCKTEIIDAMNAHLGTSYTNDSNWQEIFKVEATLPDDGDTILNQEDWPSDESGDDDYDPDRVEKRENSCSNDQVCSDGGSSNDDATSNYSLQSLEDEDLDDESLKLSITMGLESTSADVIGQGSGSGSDVDFMSGRRQRQSVDYRKLYDEMFGKDALANEQVSEDEDWGPTNRKRREKESDAASTLMTLCETEKSVKDVGGAEDTVRITNLKRGARVSGDDTPTADTNLSCKETKRSFFRIPADAVEKLRIVFATNQLPSRALKEELSNQLGLDPEKVRKWFKNARYLSLKTQKLAEDIPTQNDDPSISKECGSAPVKNESIDKTLPVNLPINVGHTPDDRRPKKFRRRKNASSATSTAMQQQDDGDLHLSTSANKVDGGVDVVEDGASLKMLEDNANKETKEAAVNDGTSDGNDQHAATAAEAHMEKLCFLKTKLEKLQQINETPC
uniref:Pathogenesis-related homeodomain protein isoform X1 n=1 Tax=Tanacetum cinerariifolium TaxID=118510 RepID=A0A6L2NRF5_TANCI|nr:pathogenesis-related homeodomain protein isoform X1 [Tanacetum cinerariifolium]